MFRFEKGGNIDRTKPLHFTFDRQSLSGCEGDTLASALLANGVDVVGRSFKYHRPRGIMAAGVEEANALVTIGKGANAEANARATVVELENGMAAFSQNAWPSLRFDILEFIDQFHAFLPAGFYYKTFKQPDWKLYEPYIRSAAGLGRMRSLDAGDGRFAHRSHHCDVLVIGAGPAGLTAALAASRAGARVMLADEQIQCGGSLLREPTNIDGRSSEEFIRSAVGEIESKPGSVVCTRAQASGYYDHNLVTLMETQRLSDNKHAPVRRLWFVRAKRVVLATGAIERPLVFTNNDRPGIMLATAALEYRMRYAVGLGRNILLATNNDTGLRTALAARRSGLLISHVVDSRKTSNAALRELLLRNGVQFHSETIATKAYGRLRVNGCEIHNLSDRTKTRLECDTVLMAGGWSPTVHLFSQSGGGLYYDQNLACFRPKSPRQATMIAGAANGAFGLNAAFREGWSSGEMAAGLCGLHRPAGTPPSAKVNDSGFNMAAHWRKPTETSKSRQWVDLQNDVTVSDIEIAAQEGYRSIEHMKRYTTSGMATDQGKTSNVTAIAILAEETGRELQEVGTTTFRPPYAPLSLGAFAGCCRGSNIRPLRRLPTHVLQRALGAVFKDAGGWLRPAYYKTENETAEDSIAREVHAVRQAAGLFESSSLGKVVVSGSDAAKFLDHIYINRASTLKTGRIRFGIMAHESGSIFDDGVFVRTDENTFIVGASSARTPEIVAHMRQWLACEWPEWNVNIIDSTSQWATLALAGPNARRIIEKAGVDIDVGSSAFPHMSFRVGHIANALVRVARLSFTGELQYEISIAAGKAGWLWKTLVAAGDGMGLAPVGTEAWSILRLERGHVFVGVDTDGATVPSDLGYDMWRQKKEHFVGRRSLSLPEMERPDRMRLIGFIGEKHNKQMPVGAHILPENSRRPPAIPEGRITSSCFSPTLKKPIAIGYLKNGRERVGEIVSAWFEGKRTPARVVLPPFYDPKGARLNV